MMPPEQRTKLRCPHCGSRVIACEREAMLAAPVVELRDGVLVLDGPFVPQPLDDVALLCTECGAELFGVEWAEERSRHLRHGTSPITDAEALDALAEELNGPGDWSGADVCELAADLLRRTGRRVEDEPDSVSPQPGRIEI